MALLFIEGFETYSVQADVTMVWDTTDTISMESGRQGGTCANIDVNDPNVITFPFNSNANVWVGFAIRNPNILGTARIVRIGDTSSNVHIGVQHIPGGRIVVTADTGSTILLETPYRTIRKNTWHYVEVRVFIDNAGTAEIWVDGTQRATTTGIDTQNGGTAQVNYLRIEGIDANSLLFDDFYLLDNSGSDNTTRLNQPIIRASFPDADTAQEDWTLSTGSDSWDLLEDVPILESTYISSSTVTDKTDLTTTNVGSNFTTIYATQSRMFALKDDATARGATCSMKSSSALSAGTELTLTENVQVAQLDMHEQDPNTSSAWTTTNLDAAEIRVEYTT